jgi:hypothetical protein
MANSGSRYDVAPYLIVVDPRIYHDVRERQNLITALRQLDYAESGTAETRVHAYVKLVLANRTCKVLSPLKAVEDAKSLPEAECDNEFALVIALMALRHEFQSEIDALKSQGLAPLRPQLVMLCDDLPSLDWVNSTDWFASENRLAVGRLRVFCRSVPAREVEAKLRGQISPIYSAHESMAKAIGDLSQIRAKSSTTRSVEPPPPVGRETGLASEQVINAASASTAPETPSTSNWTTKAPNVQSVGERYPSPKPSRREGIPEYSLRGSGPLTLVSRVVTGVVSFTVEVARGFNNLGPRSHPTGPVLLPGEPSLSPLPTTPLPHVKNPPMRHCANGSPVIGDSSTINGTPWWQSGWWTVGRDEGFREVEIDVGTAAQLAIIGLTTRGQSHRYDGRPNQDSFAILHDEEVPQYLFLALSDGVSAARHSHYSSRRLVSTVVRQMHTSIKERLATGSPLHSEADLRAIGDEAYRFASNELLHLSLDKLHSPPLPTEEIQPQDLSATLTVAIVPVGESQDGVRRALVGFVGDSPCYTLSEGEWKLVTPATKEGAVVNTATAALPFLRGEPEVATWIDVDLVSSGALFLMSDGFGTSLASGRSEVGSVLSKEWNRPRTVADFLKIAEFDRAGEDDDRTVIAVWAPPFVLAEASALEHSGEVETNTAPTTEVGEHAKHEVHTEEPA